LATIGDAVERAWVDPIEDAVLLNHEAMNTIQRYQDQIRYEEQMRQVQRASDQLYATDNLLGCGTGAIFKTWRKMEEVRRSLDQTNMVGRDPLCPYR
jgi:hypothetical protein